MIKIHEVNTYHIISLDIVNWIWHLLKYGNEIFYELFKLLAIEIKMNRVYSS